MRLASPVTNQVVDEPVRGGQATEVVVTSAEATGQRPPRPRIPKWGFVGGAIVALAAAAAISLVLGRTSNTSSPESAGSSARSSSPLPDARAVAISSLLRPGTKAKTVLYGDLDGALPEEIVIWSTDGGAGDVAPDQPYIDIFGWRDGKWASIFDATALPDEAAPIIALPPRELANRELVSLLSLVDFQQDGSPEVVISVNHQGGNTESLTLWVLSASGSSITIEFKSQDVLGTATVEGTEVLLMAHPYCGARAFCPGYKVTDIIGAKRNAISVTGTTRAPIKAKTPEEAAEGLLYAWEFNYRDTALTVASPEAVGFLFDGIGPWSPDYIFNGCLADNGSYVCEVAAGDLIEMFMSDGADGWVVELAGYPE
jgi:hypothetical protein